MSITLRTEEEIAARELHFAAIHEAGHMVISRLLGGKGRAEVWRNETRSEDERAWRGQYRQHIAPKSEGWEVLVGIAGLVAEELERGVSEVNELTGEIVAMIELGVVSVTDQQLMGDAWGENDVQRVIDLLQEHWADVCLEADCMKSYATAA